MWRVALSITAVVLNVGLVLLAAFLALGFAVDAANGQLGANQWWGLLVIVALGAGGGLSIVAIAVGARLPGKAKGEAAQVAAEFS